jgi:hypothetical protein
MSKTRATSAAKRAWPALAEFVEAGKDLCFLRKTVQLFLGEDELSCSNYFKDTTPGGDEFGFEPVALLDTGRQTSGLRIVVSLFAKFNSDSHELVSSSLRPIAVATFCAWR